MCNLVWSYVSCKSRPFCPAPEGLDINTQTVRNTFYLFTRSNQAHFWMVQRYPENVPSPTYHFYNDCSIRFYYYRNIDHIHSQDMSCNIYELWAALCRITVLCLYFTGHQTITLMYLLNLNRIYCLVKVNSFMINFDVINLITGKPRFLSYAMASMRIDPAKNAKNFT